MDELLAVLSYANFPQLDSTYQTGMSYETTATLTVVYNGGKRKVNRDYGSAGTCTLEAIYELATDDITWGQKP